MAVAATRTLLSLDAFSKILQINPLFFNQVQVPGSTVVDGNPASIFLQYSWQGSDRVGREELAEAIAVAEQQITQELTFSPGPAWAVDEFHRVTQPANSLLQNWSPFAANGLPVAQQLPVGYFQQGGLEAWDVITQGVSVAYSQENPSSGYNDTATVLASVGAGNPLGVLASEIAIFYPDQGPANPGAESGDGYEIRPTTVTIDDTTGVVTIVAPSVYFILWSILTTNQANDSAVDGTLIGNGLSTDVALPEVDVYRHWTNPAVQAVLRWEPAGYFGQSWYGGTCNCVGAGTCVACQFFTSTGCMYVRDRRQGMAVVTPGYWDQTAGLFVQGGAWPCAGRQPDQMLLNYKHGLVDSRTGELPKEWAKAIAYLAVAHTDRPLSFNNQLEPWARYWSEDFALVANQPSGTATRWQVNDTVLNNPLGTTRADVYVWRMIQRVKRGQAVSGL